MPREKSKQFYEEYLKNYTTDLDSDQAARNGKTHQGHLGPIYPKERVDLYDYRFPTCFAELGSIEKAKLVGTPILGTKINLDSSMGLFSSRFGQRKRLFFHFDFYRKKCPIFG